MTGPGSMDSRLVIFDCDGVLVDSEPIASRILAEALAELGIPLTPQQVIDRYTGISMAAVVQRIEAEFGRPVPEGFVAALRQRDQEAFRRELKPVPGVPEMLDALLLPKCVASSGSPAKMRVTLGVTGLERYFAPHIFSGDMVARGKPAPDLFLLAAHKMATPPAACVVVEDSVAGIQAARSAGMRPFGFIGGGHAGPGYGAGLRDAGAEIVFHRMTDLPDLLTAGKS